MPTATLSLTYLLLVLNYVLFTREKANLLILYLPEIAITGTLFYFSMPPKSYYSISILCCKVVLAILFINTQHKRIPIGFQKERDLGIEERRLCHS